MAQSKIIFFGNGPLADAAKSVLAPRFNIIFHARKPEDLTEVKKLVQAHTGEKIHAILASFGVLIKQDVLDLFEPEGILNLHPSKLPDLRGPSPIETAILRGDTDFTISVMKLVKQMDAGPLYYQETLKFTKSTPKSEIYERLAKTGAEWLVKNLLELPAPRPQEGTPTFSKLLDTSLSPLNPAEKSAEALYNEIRAFQDFPKSRMQIHGIDCIIKSAHVSETPEPIKNHTDLSLKCADGNYLIIDSLQPAGKKPMDAKSFTNGYLR